MQVPFFLSQIKKIPKKTEPKIKNENKKKKKRRKKKKKKKKK